MSEWNKQHHGSCRRPLFELQSEKGIGGGPYAVGGLPCEKCALLVGGLHPREQKVLSELAREAAPDKLRVAPPLSCLGTPEKQGIMTQDIRGTRAWGRFFQNETVASQLSNIVV